MKLSAVRKFRRGLRRMFYLDSAPPTVRRIIVGVIGSTILLIGIIMIVLPGPAFLVVPLGLAVLATEFIWARRWLKKLRVMMKQARTKVLPARWNTATQSPPPPTEPPKVLEKLD